MTHKAAKEDCPKRPLSAYNMFFQLERQRVVEEDGKQKGLYTRAEIFAANFDKNSEGPHRPHRKVHGKISFIDLAKMISKRWNELPAPEKKLFEERADEEKRKYAIELEEWLLRQNPTAPIKKRLGALRRGSLGKFIKAHHEELQKKKQLSLASHSVSTFPNMAATTSFPTSSYANHPAVTFEDMPPPPPRRVGNFQQEQLQPQPPQAPLQPHPPGVVSPQQQYRRKIQMQRASNLERLYRMQIQLYNEQMRLHAECSNLQDSGTTATLDYQQTYQESLSPPLKSPFHAPPPPCSLHYVMGYPQDRPYLVPTPHHGWKSASPPPDFQRHYSHHEEESVAREENNMNDPYNQVSVEEEEEEDLVAIYPIVDSFAIPPLPEEPFDAGLAIAVDPFAEDP